MRQKERGRERVQRCRFNKILERMMKGEVKCIYCEKTLETLHHKDKNHANNRLKNLIPLCHEHHLAIPHNSDIELNSMPDFKPTTPLKTVTPPKTTKSLLENCNTTKAYNLTITKPNSYIKINIQEGSVHLLEFLSALGYTEIVQNKWF